MEEAEIFVESMLSSVNEGLGDTIKAVIGSPIKYIKIKNNLKEWTKAKLDIAAVEMDTIRKKEAAKEDPKGIDKDKLAAAAKSKKDALNGKMKDIEDRLSQLATTDSLRAVVKLGKTKASLEANKKLLKIANQEELNALKLKLEDQIEKEQDTITNTENELKSYSKKEEPKKDDEPKKEEPKKDEPKKDEVKKTKEEPKKDEPKKNDVKKDKDEPKKDEPKKDEEPKKEEDDKKDDAHLTKSQKQKKEEIETLESKLPKMESDLKEKEDAHQLTIDAWKEAETDLLKAKDSKDDSKIKSAEDKYTELSGAKQQEESEIAGLQAKIKEYKQDIQDLKSKLPDSAKESENIESQQNVNEHLTNDIAARFRAAMRGMK